MSNSPSTAALKRFLTVSIVAVALLFLFWVCYFKVQDSDFWWHIKAGQLYVTSGWIVTDPFSFVREGLPYLSTHEWFAQITLYLIFSMFGSVGIVVLRFMTLLLIGAMLCTLDLRRIWPNTVLIMGMAIVMFPAVIERPQLFSNIFFTLGIVIGLRLLDGTRLLWCIVLVGTQIAWVNFHGGAAFLMLLVPGMLFLQSVIEHRSFSQHLILPSVLGLSLLLAMLASPNGWGNMTFLWLLLNDNTKQFIQEWSPHPMGDYMLHYGIFWLLALVALVTTRRHCIPSLFILLITGFLSRQAARHEIFFVLTSVCITIDQLRNNQRWQLFVERLLERRMLSIVVTVFTIFGVFLLYQPMETYIGRRNLRGFGTKEIGAKAVDFVEENQIQGPMFNTYAIGGYLLHRDRKVFIDGRNVDYGYEHLKISREARFDERVFDALAQKYGFTHAVIEYTSGVEPNTAPGYEFLNAHPNWALVFIDDHVAIYLRRLPQYETLIAERAYHLITPKGLLTGIILQDNVDVWEKELARASKENADGVVTLVPLASLLLIQGEVDTAITLAREAIRRMPYSYGAYTVLSQAFELKGAWAQAASTYKRAVDFARIDGLTLDLNRLGQLYEKAGDRK